MRLQTTPIIGSANAAVLGWGAGSLGSSPTVRYLHPWYSDQLAEVTETGLIIPRTGTLRNLFVYHGIPAGNGGDIIYTVCVAGIASPVTVTLASTASVGSDLSNSVIVLSSSILSIKVEKPLNVGQSPRNVVVTAELV